LKEFPEHCDTLPSTLSRSAMQNPRKRRRPPRSCDECRRRKVKCDRKEPCIRCIISKASCIYSAVFAAAAVPQNSSHPSSFLQDLVSAPLFVPEIRPSIDHRIARETEPTTSMTAVSSQQGDSYEVRGKGLLTPSSGLAPIEQSEAAQLEHRVRNIERLLSVDSQQRLIECDGCQDSEESISGNGRLRLQQERRIILNKSRLYGDSHWTNGAHEVCVARHCVNLIRLMITEVQKNRGISELRKW
jgi:hypothetical protein